MTVRTRFVPIAPAIYAVLGSDGMSNAVCIDGGRDGVAIIDSRFTPAYAAEMMAEVRRISSAPVTVLVNTHFHPDHVFGNQSIPTERIVAHRRTREILEEQGATIVEAVRKNRSDIAPELGDLRLLLPNDLIDDELTLTFGGLELEIQHVGRTAHTPGDLIIRIPGRGVLLVADLVSNGIVPVMRDGDPYGLAECLRTLRSDRSATVVPGHGETGGHELIDRQLTFVEQLIELVEKALRDGRSVEDAEADAKARFASMMFADQRLGDGVRLVAQHAR